MVTPFYLALQGLVFIGLLILATRRSDRFLYWASFLIPLNSISYEWISLITWAKLVFFVAVLALFVSFPTRLYAVPKKDATPVAKSLLLLFFGYASVLTTWWMTYDYLIGKQYLQTSILGFSVSQSVLRYPIQMLNFIATWGLLFVAAKYVNSKSAQSSVFQGFIAGNLVNAVLGGYQILAAYSPLPWFDGLWLARLSQYNPDPQSVGIVVGDHWFPRLSGLGGEPKHTGANLVIALLLVTLLHRTKHENIRLYLLKVVILFLAILLTFSSGAWIALAVASLYTLMVSSRSSTARLISAVSSVSLLVVFIFVASNNQFIQVLYEERISSKLSQERFSVYGDSHVLQYLLERPRDLLVGRGSGSGDFVLADEVSLYKRSLYPAYVSTRLLVEFGLVGLLIVILIIVAWLRFLFRTKQFFCFHLLLSGTLVCLLSHTISLYGYLFIIGAALAPAIKHNWPEAARERLGVHRYASRL